jgi:Cof subfamily protein (haloacid dehalogenase superfamily)
LFTISYLLHGFESSLVLWPYCYTKNIMYKALITDIDGTLVPVTGNGSTIDEPTIQAFKAAIDDGCKIGAATGRGWQSTKPVVERLGISDLCIIEGGACIINPQTEETIWERKLDALTSHQVVELFKRLTNHGELIKSSAIPERVPLKEAEANAYLLPNRVIYLLGATKDTALAVQQALHELPRVAANLTTPSWASPDLYDVHVTHQEGTKSQALQEWMRLLHLDKTECIGVGDSANDIPLFEAVGLKVAVGNASDDLKERADVIAPNRDTGALAYILRRFILNRS